MCPLINKTSISLKAGQTFALKVTNGAAKKWTSSNTKIAGVTSKGVVTGLKKGTATITATLYSGKKLTCKVNVTTNPTINKKKVAVYIGGKATVKLTGKAAAVKNVYTNTKVAKFTSKATDTTLTIKGLKAGNTNLKVKVNGSYVLTIKVVVAKTRKR